MMRPKGKTKSEKMQDFVRFYRERTGQVSVDMKDVAAMAQQMGWKMPQPKEPIDLLAQQFSDSQREEVRTDEVTGRLYRANLATSEWRAHMQYVLWTDIEVASRFIAHKALNQYRDQMIGEAVMMTTTAEHWNRVHPNEEPLNMPLDFGPDVEWELNAPPKDLRAA